MTNWRLRDGPCSIAGKSSQRPVPPPIGTRSSTASLNCARPPPRRDKKPTGTRPILKRRATAMRALRDYYDAELAPLIGKEGTLSWSLDQQLADALPALQLAAHARLARISTPERRTASARLRRSGRPRRAAAHRATRGAPTLAARCAGRARRRISRHQCAPARHRVCADGLSHSRAVIARSAS